jgi:hypothetical protein
MCLYFHKYTYISRSVDVIVVNIHIVCDPHSIFMLIVCLNTNIYIHIDIRVFIFINTRTFLGLWKLSLLTSILSVIPIAFLWLLPKNAEEQVDLSKSKVKSRLGA